MTRRKNGRVWPNKKLTERGEHLANPNKFMKDIQAKVDALKELRSGYAEAEEKHEQEFQARPPDAAGSCKI